MRGKHRTEGYGNAPFRNIPAYAGKTDRKAPARIGDSEHPRVCGENLVKALYVVNKTGTSPRMRGKRYCTSGAKKRRRNIPAYAGKTTSEFTVVKSEEEHPRVCGENARAHMRGPIAQGTSPRMRGKPVV